MRQRSSKAAYWKRSAGERAFDRCLLSSAFSLSLTIIGCYAAWLASVASENARMEAELAIDASVAHRPIWLTWAPSGLGVLLGVYWIWAFVSVVRGWRDPDARVLRFSSLALLAFQAIGIFTLLHVRRNYYPD